MAEIVCFVCFCFFFRFSAHKIVKNEITEKQPIVPYSSTQDDQDVIFFTFIGPKLREL